MNLKNKIFLFDVNHTLINTATGHLRAMDMMFSVLVKNGLKKDRAKEVIKRVHFTTSLMIAGFLIGDDLEWEYVPGGKNAYKELLCRINDSQRKILSEWGFIKKWSREVFLKIALDDEGIKASDNLLRQVTDAHWEGITKYSTIFNSGKILFRELKKQKIPTYILTSSDGRLIFKNSHFFYDPEYSEMSKKRRMMVLKENGIDFDDIVIGDPYDKPSIDFFERGISMIEKNLGRKVSRKELVIVGNSYEDDMETPIKKLGFGIGILVEQGRKNKKINGNIIHVGDLTNIIELL